MRSSAELRAGHGGEFMYSRNKDGCIVCIQYRAWWDAPDTPVPDPIFHQIHVIALVPGLGAEPHEWDGNVEKPTLRPSIRAWDGSPLLPKNERIEMWHGYLTAGVFKSC